MRSKTSCFNATVFKKNLTRFAPLWGLYTLCLCLGTLLIYSNGGNMKDYWFAANMAELLQYTGVINLIYAPVAAQLLLGDLYSSRMCNAMHAMPLRRETWFCTNVLSGLAFSLLPSAAMTLLALPLMGGSMVENAWQIPLYVFAGINLEFVCFFGMAVFCALCVGNRLAMVMLYGLLNFGSFIAYWLIDTVYTPMLYGVVTPTKLVHNLCPIAILTGGFIEMDSLWELRDIFGEKLIGASTTFALTKLWGSLLIYAAAGTVFGLAGLMLYRTRKLECAGDALAYTFLEPVFLVIVSVVTATGAHFFLDQILGMDNEYNMYINLTVGLVVGWFACKMFLARTTRVFRLKNWLGLGGLFLAMALTLVATRLDIFRIDDYIPDAADIKTVSIDCQTGRHAAFTESEDIANALLLHELALEDRLENYGSYVIGLDGNLVYYVDSNDHLIDKSKPNEFFHAARVNLTYELYSGKVIQRRYNVWSDGLTGDILREFLSRWEVMVSRYGDINDTSLAMVLADPQYFYIDGTEVPEELINRETMESLIAAIQADCEDRTLAQSYHLHNGHFSRKNPDPEAQQDITTPSLWLSLQGKDSYWAIDIFPDSENTLNWLRSHGLLAYEVREENLY